MKIDKKKIKTEVHFERDECMKLLIHLTRPMLIPEVTDAEMLLFKLTTLYLAHKLGAELKKEEQEVVDIYRKSALKI